MRCYCLNVRVIWLVDLSVAYYNSKPQVKALLNRLRGLIDAIPDREGPEAMPRLSQLAQASRSDTPRAVRDRLDVDELERLLIAARADVPRMQLAAEFGVSRKTIYRLLKATGSP
jgi:transcriptional regulator of acetoin/glycerol metabolism